MFVCLFGFVGLVHGPKMASTKPTHTISQGRTSRQHSTVPHFPPFGCVRHSPTSFRSVLRLPGRNTVESARQQTETAVVEGLAKWPHFSNNWRQTRTIREAKESAVTGSSKSKASDHEGHVGCVTRPQTAGRVGHETTDQSNVQPKAEWPADYADSHLRSNSQVQVPRVES